MLITEWMQKISDHNEKAPKTPVTFLYGDGSQYSYATDTFVIIAAKGIAFPSSGFQEGAQEVAKTAWNFLSSPLVLAQGKIDVAMLRELIREPDWDPDRQIETEYFLVKGVPFSTSVVARAIAGWPTPLARMHLYQWAKGKKKGHAMVLLSDQDVVAIIASFEDRIKEDTSATKVDVPDLVFLP